MMLLKTQSQSAFMQAWKLSLNPNHPYKNSRDPSAEEIGAG